MLPAQSTGRYTQIDWDAVRAEYRVEIAKRQERRESDRGESNSDAQDEDER